MKNVNLYKLNGDAFKSFNSAQNAARKFIELNPDIFEAQKFSREIVQDASGGYCVVFIPETGDVFGDLPESKRVIYRTITAKKNGQIMLSTPSPKRIEKSPVAELKEELERVREELYKLKLENAKLRASAAETTPVLLPRYDSHVATAAPYIYDILQANNPPPLVADNLNNDFNDLKL